MSDDHDQMIRAEIDAYRAEARAFREESAARLDAYRTESAARIDAYRAETTAFRAESAAQFDRLMGRFDQLDREVGAIARQLMKLIEGQNGQGSE
ncbi:MAG: hypothetical protein ABSB73_11915 [Solirubrobacteraceae bacterium]|jgi:hypothetical protein